MLNKMDDELLKKSFNVLKEFEEEHGSNATALAAPKPAEIISHTTLSLDIIQPTMLCNFRKRIINY